MAEARLCECGCGEVPPVATKTNRLEGRVKGEQSRFVLGHNRRKPGWAERIKTPTSSDGFCECGCGQRTLAAPKTDRSKGWVKGRPLRFALGHNAIVTNHPRRLLSPSDYTVQDRGYTSPCWIWNGAPAGPYGHCRVGIDGGYDAAHRAYYERFVGPLRERDHLHHLCEQPPCVNPDHLQPLTPFHHLSLHHRKLSDEQVRAIRDDKRSLKAIAEEYGMSQNYICSIRTGYARARVA